MFYEFPSVDLFVSLFRRYKAKKKKFVAPMGMWTHFCPIALRAKSFFFSSCPEKNGKVGQKHYKKEFATFRIAHFL